MSYNSYSVNLRQCSQENAGSLRMQAQRSRPDQTHWQDVNAVNQNDPIQAVGCTSLAARLETRTCYPPSYYSVQTQHCITDTFLKKTVSLLFTSFGFFLRCLRNTEPLMSEIYILSSPCWDTSGRTIACSRAILYCHFNANYNYGQNLFTFQTYFTRPIRNIMQKNRYNTNIKYLK